MDIHNFKKRQLRDKIEFLKNAYGRRWVIVVSNRGLVPEYSKFGLCCQRKNVKETIEKLIKI